MNDLDGEVWKDISGWPFHQVSNLGRVRVLPGGTVHSRCIIETELRKLTKHTNGYLEISGGGKTHLVHHLVLNEFDGSRPFGHECSHFNGDRSDNRWPENIAWKTHEENCEDRIRHGTHPSRERNPNSKLTESDVNDIRSRPGYYGVNTQLAEQYGVSHSTISIIRSNKTWIEARK
jgi:hypothetical protein